MSNGIISKKEFQKIQDTNVKLDILFDTILQCTQKRGLKDVYAFLGGMLGGFIAIVTKSIFWD
jgi:hypothetical protein